MAYQNLLISDRESLRIITINRPDQLNALNRATIAELSDALTQAEATEAVRVLILRGAGDKAFVAGADIKEFSDFDIAQGQELSRKGHELLFNKVEQLRTPVIAAINGYALGGGLELAMSCHMRVAAQHARLGLPEVSLGLIPGYGGTQRLSQLVGKGLALEMILSAQMIDAERALKQGLVNHTCPAEELMDTCTALAERISKNSPVALAAAIRAVNARYAENVDGLEVEIDAFASCFASEDFKEGTRAFLEKRKPSFTGK